MSLSLRLSDNDYLDPEEIEQEMESLTIDQLWKMSQIPHVLHFIASDFQKMPTLPFVKSFQLHDMKRPQFDHQLSFVYSTVFHMSSMSLLGSVEVTDSLPLVPESVEIFTYSIATHRELSLNPARDAANYLSPNGLDEFSSTFRTFSMQLREVHLENARVSSAFFWPETEEDIDKMTLYWPNLEILKILEVPPYTPDGKWILDNDPTKYWEGDLEEDSFEP
ncbi:hypothetical protein SI65_09104 [Aspergillus cristatus]|uniref:Uncharacterized protein n=1 Tax=Aspergillus cristatus TaxID=573508 RepID=A0A1E3B3V3_ASPCR|nr:hypothetical protein SI65_09104 [Aspergillus cristatus]